MDSLVSLLGNGVLLIAATIAVPAAIALAGTLAAVVFKAVFGGRERQKRLESRQRFRDWVEGRREDWR